MDVSQDLGAFTFPNVEGEWMRPGKFAVDVAVGSLTNRAQVEASRPPVGGAGELRWRARDPITPTARVVNIDSQSQWQTALTAAAIGFGIGGSLLAALLFDMLVRRRPRPAVGIDAPALPQAPATLGEASPPEPVAPAAVAPPEAEPRRGRIMLLATLALFVGFLLGSRSRGRS